MSAEVVSPPDGSTEAGHVRRLHHVAFAEGAGAGLATSILPRLLGLTVTSVEVAAGFTERMIDVGNCYLQGLEATGDGVVQESLDRRGPGLHHIALEVDDLRATIADLSSAGVMFVDPEPRRGGGQTMIAFAHPRSFGGILVEFVELTG